MEESLAASLVRLVKADANDFSSRNKLRLLRVCRALCPQDASSEIAIVLQSVLAVGPILCKLMGGDKEENGRATLADLCSCDGNPISQAQDRIVQRLQAWGDGASPLWSVLTSVGVNFEDPRCALKAKAELLTLSAGLLDHFELRMSAPP